MAATPTTPRRLRPPDTPRPTGTDRAGPGEEGRDDAATVMETIRRVPMAVGAAAAAGLIDGHELALALRRAAGLVSATIGDPLLHTPAGQLGPAERAERAGLVLATSRLDRTARQLVALSPPNATPATKRATPAG